MINKMIYLHFKDTNRKKNFKRIALETEAFELWKLMTNNFKIMSGALTEKEFAELLDKSTAKGITNKIKFIKSYL